MGRLFWKFFAFVWLSQLAAIVAVGMLFWLTARPFEQALEDIDASPVATVQVSAAGAILQYAGTDAFKSWVAQQPGPSVFAIDGAGHDLLARPMPPGLVAQIRRIQSEAPASSVISNVTAAGGQHYLLFPDARPAWSSGGRVPGPAHGRGSFILPPALPMFGTLVASVLTALLLARYVAKPIRSLRTGFEAAAAGNLALRVGPLIGRRRDELGDLGRDFDRMALRLHTAMTAQRQLLHDMSHELRSPLARLQIAVGLIRQKPAQPQSAVLRIEMEIERIDRLVGDLLKLSRLESGELTEMEEAVDMHELLHDVVTDANFEAQASGRSVVWREQGSVTLRGQSALLHGAIENIVRNALKHAPETRIVHVETEVDTTNAYYTLRVLDAGPGVADEELPRLFTPFFRAATATPKDGYGLGLAITRRVIEVHGGMVSAVNRRGGGLCVSVELPLRQDRSATRCLPTQSQ